MQWNGGRWQWQLLLTWRGHLVYLYFGQRHHPPLAIIYSFDGDIRLAADATTPHQERSPPISIADRLAALPGATMVGMASVLTSPDLKTS